MKNLSSLLKNAFAVLAIASASCGFVLMALPTPAIGIMFIALSMFFSLCWGVSSLLDDLDMQKQWEEAKQRVNNK